MDHYSYDKFDFVDNGQIMDMFICKICQCVSKDPYETKCCNNTFCKSCIDTAKEKGITSCPLCRRQFYQIMQAVQISRQIQNLQVYCKNKNQGCTWIGALETKNVHLKECLYKKVPCEYHIVGCNAVVIHKFQMIHNKDEMKMHFSMVAKYVEESNSTKQQLANSNQKLQDTRQKLINTQEELDKSNREVEFYKKYDEDEINAIVNKLEDTKKELEDSKKELEETKKELQDTKKELQDTKKELQDTKKELDNTKKNLQGTKKELENAKTRYQVKLADSNKTVDKLTYYIVIFFFVVALIFSYMIKR